MAVLLQLSRGAPFSAGLKHLTAVDVVRSTSAFRRPTTSRSISTVKSPILSSIQLRGGAEEERGNISSSSKQPNAPRSLFPHRKSSALQRRSHSTTTTSTTTTTEKETNLHETTNLNVSVFAAQGRRSYMEDEFVVAQDFAAVFDGHGGPSVSRYLKSNLFANLQSALPWVLDQKQQQTQTIQQQPPLEMELSTEETTELKGSIMTSSSCSNEEESILSADPTVQDYSVALRLALDKVDREVQRISHWSFQGSTAVAAWIHRDAEDTTTLIVANVGDSRAIYGFNGTATPLTRDHKPDDPKETERIEALGGKVVWCGPYDGKGKPVLSEGIYRVNGNLALSRAIGDRSERPAVTADPDITYIKIQNDNSDSITDAKASKEGKQKALASGGNEYVVLATDGLWDVFTNEEVVTIIDLLLDKTKGELRHQQSQIAEVLVREALRRGAFDNITVIIIWLHTAGDTTENESRAQKDPIEPAS